MELKEKLKKEIKREAFGATEPIKERKPKDNQWQEYLGVCLRKVDPNDEKSKSAIEVLENVNLNVNEQMRACATEWHKTYRNKENPKQAITKDLKIKLKEKDEYI